MSCKTKTQSHVTLENVNVKAKLLLKVTRSHDNIRGNNHVKSAFKNLLFTRIKFNY